MKTNYSEKISICQNKQKNLCLFEVSKWKMIVGVLSCCVAQYWSDEASECGW